MALMEQPHQQAAINMTAAQEALAPWLSNPWRLVVRIEVFTAVAAALLLFQLIFGSFRRQTSSFFIQSGLWVAYTLLFPLITYTLGLMQSSPVKSGLYPVWALLLCLIAGCTNSITAYDLDDNKQWKRHLFQLIQYVIYVSMIQRLLFPDSDLQFYLNPFSIVPQPINVPFNILVAVAMFNYVLTVLAGWMVNYSDHSKVVADYMRDQADSRIDGGVFDPATMKGYKYLVYWPGYMAIPMAGPASYRHVLPADNVITIDTIWEKCGDSLFNSCGSVSQLKDVCLSFSLSHLLKRRFFGMDCPEAAFPETRNFVLKGLLGENGDDYERAFRVIEVELGFLYDSFFTRYACIFEMEKTFFVMVVLKISCTVAMGIFLFIKSPILEAPNPVIKVETRTIDTAITILIMGAFLVVEVVQFLVYLGSDWAIVSVACAHTRSYFQAILPVFRRTFGFLRCLNRLPYWKNEIGQCSVIEDFWMAPNKLACILFSKAKYLPFFAFLKLEYWLICSTFRVRYVKVPTILRREIVSSLKSISGRVSNGEALLQRIGDLGRFPDHRTQTEIMLIWHTATEYCNIAVPVRDEVKVDSSSAQPGDEHLIAVPVPDEVEVDSSSAQAGDEHLIAVPVLDEVEVDSSSAQAGDEHLIAVPVLDEVQVDSSSAQAGDEQLSICQRREVAIMLSRYCVYLMYSIPELLPGNFADTQFVFECVSREAIEARKGKRPTKDRLVQIISEGQDDISEGQDDSIFRKGLKLGMQLEGMEDCWKVMAEFWVETILDIAPSDNAKAHMERLAQGGEFLTHIWALLTHAGILTRSQVHEPTPEEGTA